MRSLVALFATCLAAAALAGPAAAADLRLSDLEVAGGSETWSADNAFTVFWKFAQPASPGDPTPVLGVRYRVLDPEGEEVRGARLDGRAISTNFWLPVARGASGPVPGEYALEVWAYSATGEGPRLRTGLRFDDVPPAAPAARVDATWFRAGVEPVLRIEPAAAPPPVSGLQGYAVGLRRGSPAPPCALPDRCGPGEIDLPAAPGEIALPLGRLAEGVHVASVAAVSNAGVPSPSAATALVRVDATRPDLALEGTGNGWSNRPVRVLARATDPLSGMEPAGPQGPRTTIRVDGGTPIVAAGPEASAVVSGSGVHTVATGARDLAGNARGEDPESPPLTGLVRIDETPPTVTFSRAGDPADPELLEAVVGDALSGPARSGTIGVRPLGSTQAFVPLPTSSEDGRLRARWDSDAAAHGAYEFRATGFDAAGNGSSSERRANGVPLVLLNPLKRLSVVRFGFGGRRLVWHRCRRSGGTRRCRRQVIESFGRRPASRTVPFGRGVGVGGRAVDAEGAPLAGVEIEVVESFEPGAGATSRVTRVLTAADGSFFARLAPGPSRRVEARFGGTPLLTRASGRELRLGVQTAVSLRASSERAVVGGRPVLFSGRVVPGEATIPPYGRPVQLQFRLPGMEWTDFRTVQTDERGRFRYPYSFSDDDSRGVRFHFRAYAPPQPGWPYEPATSRPITVTGG